MVYTAAAKYLCNIPEAESARLCFTGQSPDLTTMSDFCPRAASLLSFMFLNCKDESGSPIPILPSPSASQHEAGGYVDGYVDDIANGLICSNYQRGSISESFQLSLHRWCRAQAFTDLLTLCQALPPHALLQPVDCPASLGLQGKPQGQGDDVACYPSTTSLHRSSSKLCSAPSTSSTTRQSPPDSMIARFSYMVCLDPALYPLPFDPPWRG